jgi:AraC-like DNA-binding protein
LRISWTNHLHYEAMTFIEYPIGLQTNVPAQEGAGAFRCFRSRSLMDVVDAIWDCDIADGDAARKVTIKHAPGTSLLLMAQYRAPVVVRQGGRDLPVKCATQVQENAVTMRPTGALGVIIVCLRPDAASRIVDAPLGDFANANIHLGSLFSVGEVSMCDDLLMEARNSPERIATVEAFLLRRLRPQLDNLACYAASLLRRDPTASMQGLASRLGVSARQLSRSFNATFGIGPKQFARLARFERIVTERRKGSSWAEIAYACGLTDQAHLIREFRSLAGELPTKFFAQELRIGAGGMSDANFVVQQASGPTG